MVIRSKRGFSSKKLLTFLFIVIIFLVIYSPNDIDAAHKKSSSAKSGTNTGVTIKFIDDGLSWVWEEAGEVQGFAAYIPMTGTIEVLYIHHLAQGQGIGTALLRQCCDELRELGLHEAILSTTPGTKAENFYRNRGWTEFGVNEVGDLLFKLPLG